MRYRGRDWTGEKWENLEVVGKGEVVVDHKGRKIQLWKVKCSACNAVVQWRMYARMLKETHSCGCLRYSYAGRQHRGEGHKNRTAEYNTWIGMKQRCSNPTRNGSESYVGKVVCRRWQQYEAFLADMGRKPSPTHTIDRIDNDIGYACGSAECVQCVENQWPMNCRWATRADQAINRKVVHQVEWNGKTQSLPEWATELGFSVNTLRGRYRRGWRGAALFGPLHRDLRKQETT